MKYQKITVPIAIVNLIALIAVTLRLPEQVPIHININNVVDGYGSRWFVPLLGAIPLLLLLSMEIYHRCTKNNINVQKNKKAESIVLTAIALFFVAVSWVPVVVAKQITNQADLHMELIIGLPMGVLMIILGNFMGVIKQNHYIGVRTKWTLSNEEVWRKTHRKAAYWSVLAGVIMVISALTSYVVHNTIIFFAGLILSVALLAVVPIIYSYVLYKRINNK